MSKRMVTYGLTNDDKVASIDGHAVGGGVGDKSISRRMITYKVDDTGKIISIDGHELNGGGGDYQIKELVVTENGVYDVAGEAYKPVRVNVPQTAQSGTLKALLDATKSTTSLFYGYQGTSVADLISYNDTANVTITTNMFYNCSELVTIPRLDTSKVTTMFNMFNGCSKLTSIPQLDTHNVTDMGGMFDACSSLTEIPQLNTSNVISMSGTFRGCRSLTSIPQLDVSKIDREMSSTFEGCTSLTSIGMYGFTRSINISKTALEHDALVAFLNQAGTAFNSSQKITMGSAKLALLSDEEKAIATNKGWTLA